MKKFLLLLTLLCTMFSTVFATEVTIGDDASTNYSYYFPLRSYYKYAFNQQIYTSDEIGMAGTITSITLSVKGSATLTTPRTFDIYMVEVVDTVFASSTAWVALSEDNLVYSGTETFNDPTAQSMTFTLETPFVYSGQSNLLIAFHNTTGAYQGSSTDGVQTQVFGVSTGSKTIYANRDSGGSLGGLYDITAPGVTGTLSGLRNVITLGITPNGGPVIQCDKPETVDMTDVTANSATVNVAGGSQTYNVEIKGGSYDDWTFVTKNTQLTAIPLTGLTPYTSYQVRVQSVCGENTSSYKSASFKTLIGIPYVDALATQGDWTKKQALLSDIMSGAATFGTSTGTWNFGARNGVLGGPHAYMNLYGTSCKNWIISPVIPLPENGNYVLTYQVALTDYNSANPIDNLGNQPDDKLVVLVSADSCQTWSILHQWDNEGSAYVYDEIPTTGIEIEADLSAYAGQSIQIAFYGESTSSNGDNDIHVGNVLVDYAPSCMTPTDLAAVTANTTKNSVQLDWTANSGETAWILEYKQSSADEWIAAPITTKPYTISGLSEFTEYNVRIAAKCSDAEDGTSKFCKAITIKTASGVPFAQDFNLSALPSEWQRYDAKLSSVQSGGALEATKNGWNVVAKASANNIFDSAYHVMLNLADTMNYWLVGPTIEMEAGYELTFSLALTTTDGAPVTAGGQPDDVFAVLLFDGEEWNELGVWNNSGSSNQFDAISSGANGQTVKIDMDAYAGQNIRLAFYGQSSVANGDNNIHIANLKIAEKPACSPALSLNINDLDATTATAVWTTDEPGSVWQYGMITNPGENFEPADSLFTNDTTALSVALEGLTAETTYAFFLRKVCDNSYSSPIVRTFTTYAAPKTIPWNEDFELYTANTFVPYWDVSASTSYEATTTKHYIWGVYDYTSGNNKMIRMYNSLVKAGTAVINTPRVDLAPENGCMLSFDYTHAASCDPFSVRISIDNGKTWTELASYGNNASNNTTNPGDFTRVEINLSAYAGQVVMFQFYAVANYGSGAIFVDNISVTELPDCVKPTNLAVSSVSPNGAVLTWDNEQNAVWEYVCVPDSVTELPAYTPCAQNAVQLENLSEKTDYIFYLRKACGNSVSDSIFVNFTTPCSALSIAENGGQYVEGFEDYEGVAYNVAGVTPECWATGGTSTYAAPHVVVSGSYAYVHEGQNGLNFCASANSYAYAMMPAFVEELSSLQITFWSRMESASNGSLILGYITEYSDNFEQIAVIPSTTTMTKHEILLSDVPEEATRLVFVWNYSGSSYYSCGIDDIVVEPIPTCLKPTNLAVIDSLTTTNSVTLTWTPGIEETNWFVQYKKSADSVWTLVPDSVKADTFMLAGLDAASVYDVRVAAWCNTNDSTTDVSEYCNPISFATACATVTSFPYSENFDAVDAGTSGAVNVLPICWNQINTTTYSSYMGYPIVYKGATYANTPNNSLKFYSYAYGNSSTNYDPQDQYAILPEMEGLNGLRIKFNARKYSASYDATFTVGIMTDPTDAATFVVIDTIRPAAATYEQFIVPFSAYAGTGKYIAIKMEGVEVPTTSSAAYRGMYIDDIVVEEIPNCLEPIDLAVVDSLITMNSAVLTWTAQGDEAAWVLQYKKHAAEEWTSVPATATTLTLENLESATMYDVQVAAKCGETELSPFTAVQSFVTTCGAYSIVESGVYTEGFEAYEGAAYNATTGIIPNCWEAYTTNSSNIAPHVIKPTDTYAYIHSGEKALTFYGSGYCYAVMPEFAEPLNTLQITFWAAMESASYGILKLGYITEANPDVFHEIATYDRTAAKVMAQYETVLNALPDSAARLVFQWYYSGQWSCCIDDIEVSLIPNCLKPTNLAVDSIAKHAALISWKAQNEETAWAVQYKKSADSTWLDAPVANDTIYLLENLDDATSYDVQVAAICSESETSEYSTAISFITDCDALTEFPYAEGFDSIAGVTTGHMMPLCWSSINTCTYSTYSYYPTVYKGATYASTATNSLKFYSYGYSSYDPQDQYAILPEMENISSLNLKFNARKYSASYPADFYVGVMTNPSDTATFVEIAHLNPTSATYEAFEVPFNHYEGNGQFIAIKMVAPASSYKGIHIDDIVVEKLPACMQPEDLEVSDITASSATIKWVNGTSAQNAWQIVYSCNPEFNIEDVTEGEIIDIASNPYALAGLTVDTLYNVYVRAYCGEDGVSAWSTISFHTASACQTPTDLAVAEITASSASISWNTYGQNGFNLRYSTNDSIWLDTIMNITDTPYVLTGLSANEDYYVQVQNDCNVEEWSESVHFKTTCVAWSIANDGDYVEDFDSYTGTAYSAAGVAPDCWEIGGTSTYVPHVVTGTSYAWTHSGANSFGFTGSANSYCYAVLPQFEEDLNRLQISLWTRMESISSGTLSLGYITADENMIYVLKNYPSATSLVRHEDNLDTIPAEATRLVLLWQYTGTSYYSCTVDDIEVSFIPTCLKPENVNATDIAGHSATISWTPGAEGQDAWQIAYDTLPSKQPDTLANIINVTENPYLLTGLNPLTQYYVYVRANCGEQNGMSKWSDVKSFKTAVACPAPTGLAAELTAGNGEIATLTWNAGDANAWTVEYSLNSNMSDSIALNVTEPVVNLTGLTAEATYYARVKADCGELDGKSAYSDIISFKPTAAYLLTVNDGTNTNGYIPVNGSNVDYVSQRSQFIIPEAALEELEWDSIKSLTFYGSYTSTSRTNWGDALFEVYVAEAPEATMAAEADWNAMTQVMTAASLSIVDGKMVVTFDAPYQYEGGNLMIGIKQTVAGTWAGCNWYGVTANGASFGGYGTSTNFVQRNFLPKLTIEYAPGVGPACPKAKNLAVSEITESGATFTWKAVEGAAWEYAVAEVSVAEPTDFIAVAEGANSIVIDYLNAETAYVFYLRRACGVDGNSEVVSIEFETQEIIAAIPFVEDFSNAQAWKLNNDVTNAWVIGTAANNGANALYISNNGGMSYAYDGDVTSASFVSKLFNFEVADTTYVFEYDWKGEGEYYENQENPEESGPTDYLRVGLVPASSAITAGVAVLPAGWMALDGDTALLGAADWQHKRVELAVQPGLYKVVFVWINDEADAEGTPAAISNFSISFKTGEATGLEPGNAGNVTKAVKFIRNNQVYILLNGVVYTVTGQRVELK